jgi:flagellar motor switch protein FliG
MVKDKDNLLKLSGPEKVAIIMLAIKEETAAHLFSLMSEDEIKEVSASMASLGTVKPEIVERLVGEFIGEMRNSAGFMGNLETTERLLEKILGSRDKVNAIMEEIRGPAGRNTWDKLGNVNEEVLAAYLKNEYPQTVALITSKISPSHAARVLSVLPEDFTFEVLMRMLNMDAVKREVLDGVERTLRAEFISTLTKTQKYDSNEMIAEIFNNFDRSNEAKFMSMLEERVPEAAEKIKSLMFTFDDLGSLNEAGIQSLLRNVDKSKLPIALKGASQAIRDLFLNNMSQRAAKILMEDIDALGPVRLRDVDEAQSEIVSVAKEMSARGEIVIADNNEQDEFIY